MRALLRRVRRRESPVRDRGAALLAMSADQPKVPEAKAELRKAGEVFREAREETPATPRS